jgi:hypothetical protein
VKQLKYLEWDIYRLQLDLISVATEHCK